MNSASPTPILARFPRRTALQTSLALLFVTALGSISLEAASAKSAGGGKNILFLVSEDPDNYEATKTIPPFAEMLKREHGYQTTVLHRGGTLSAATFPGLEAALAKADLLVFFTRRVALTTDQLNAIKKFLKSGKPLVGIRTANHGFAPRGEIAKGHEAWTDFVPDILGAINRGYGRLPEGKKQNVRVIAKNHPILKGVNPQGWSSQGSLYLTAPLVDGSATVLLEGEVDGKVEPIAWTRMSGQSRVFYTSLGYPSDFDLPPFRTMLINGIRWALEK